MSYEQLVEACNDYLKHMYNPGALVAGSPQHCQLIKAFFAGAICTMSDENLLQLQGYINNIGSKNWYPSVNFHVP